MAANAGFIPKNFDELIETHGYNASWYQSIVCECMIEGQPDPHCPYCKGEGYRYIRRKEIKVVATSFNGKQVLKLEGISEPGTVYVTPERDIIMSYHDKLDFYEIDCRYSQVVTVNGNKTSSTYRPIKKVIFVMVGDYVYDENIDFKISEDKHHLEWIDESTKPPNGARVSVLYLTSPEYMIKEMTHELRSVNVSKGLKEPQTDIMPKQYLATRINFAYGNTVNAKREYEPSLEKDGGFAYD